MADPILILGGTREASDLTAILVAKGKHVITSLAGRTKNPSLPKGEIRIGGFGGVNGLAQYLKDESIDLLIDATHPFASKISENARRACDLTGVALMTFSRPAWVPEISDNWTCVEDTTEANRTLPEGATVFLALGSQHLEAFSGRDDLRFVLRMVDAPETLPPFKNCTVVIGTPSTSISDELALLKEHGITHLVCRNSGGKGSFAKIEAARELSLPVIMISRPPRIEGETFESIDALVNAVT